MNEELERELLEDVYRMSYHRTMADKQFAMTPGGTLNQWAWYDGFLLGLKSGIRLALPKEEWERMSFCMEAVDYIGDDDADDGEPMDADDAIRLAYASWKGNEA